MPHPVIIHTDGACLGNPGPGGWGAVLRCGDKTRELSGGDAETTNNRMEMTAIIRALSALKGAHSAHVHTDSQYVQRGMTEWLPKWRQNGFRSAKGDAVKNVDLWRQLDELAGRRLVKWLWVRGHDGDTGNERADALAAAAARKTQNGS